MSDRASQTPGHFKTLCAVSRKSRFENLRGLTFLRSTLYRRTAVLFMIVFYIEESHAAL